MPKITLDDVTFFDPEIDGVLARWRGYLEALCNLETGGACTFESGPTGFTLHVQNQNGARHAVVQSPGISAATGPDSLGTGPIMLRRRTAGGLVNDRPGILWINFTRPIPTGTRITVVPDGSDWTIPGANCPP